ncbi:Rrf2 family transcriptional regulator, partial [Rhizobium leguminosarum]|uniref:Rrf2 family transcriptional regulator n=1 Tax=Rhizobium leguminosarum TaxID=384 RepID=UPI003F95C122
ARNNIPKKFLDTILLELLNVGILRSKKGPGGGYSLSRPATEILIGHVIRTLDVSNALLAEIVAIIAEGDASIGETLENHFSALETLRTQAAE